MSRPANVADYREAARRRLPHVLFEYVDGAAYAEQTLRANTADFQALTSLALQYQRRNMNWAGEAAEIAGEQVRRGEHAMLSAAGAKPGEGRRE